jgi:hypothetical protein
VRPRWRFVEFAASSSDLRVSVPPWQKTPECRLRRFAGLRVDGGGAGVTFLGARLCEPQQRPFPQDAPEIFEHRGQGEACCGSPSCLLTLCLISPKAGTDPFWPHTLSDRDAYLSNGWIR